MNYTSVTYTILALTSMATEDFVIYDGGYGQAVETVGERLPQLDVIPPLA